MKYWWGCRETELLIDQWEYKNGKATMETGEQFLKKVYSYHMTKH